MGKLHTLRRAILRDPQRWLDACGGLDGWESWYSHCKAVRRNGEWVPCGSYMCSIRSYKAFVYHVLQGVLLGGYVMRSTRGKVGNADDGLGGKQADYLWPYK